MAFNASKYAIKSPKPMHVFLLLDTSGSMYGEKILSLEESVKEMLQSFSSLEKEVEIKISLISFSDTAELLIQAQNSQSALNNLHGLKAWGQTKMGAAFHILKQLIEDRDILPSRSYRPLIVLVSDGAPTDQYLPPLHALIHEGRSKKAQRLALAIGNDANLDTLQQFIGDVGTDDDMPHLFYASGAKDIHKFFKFVTMSVTTTTTCKAAPANFNEAAAALASDSPAEMFQQLSSQQLSAQHSSSLASQKLATSYSSAQQQEDDPFHGDLPYAPPAADMNQADDPYHGDAPVAKASQDSRANTDYATSSLGGFNQAPMQSYADKLNQARTLSTPSTPSIQLNQLKDNESDYQSFNSPSVQTTAPTLQGSALASQDVAPSFKPSSRFVVKNLSEDEDWPF